MMKKQIAIFAGLALSCGVASAQDAPSLDPVTGGLSNIFTLLDNGVINGSGLLAGLHAPGGADPNNDGAGRGVLGGSDFLADVLLGGAEEGRAGSTEGGALLGNTLQDVLSLLAVGVLDGGGSLASALQDGGPALSDALAGLGDPSALGDLAP